MKSGLLGGFFLWLFLVVVLVGLAVTLGVTGIFVQREALHDAYDPNDKIIEAPLYEPPAK